MPAVPQPIIRIEDVSKTFPLKRNLFDRRTEVLRALTDVRIDVPAGQTLGLVGESGCGKTTLARLMVARALSVRPAVLIADEAVSSLDVSVRAQILNLLADLRAELGLTLVFISHDLRVVDHLCDRMAVMYLGRVVELGPTADVLGRGGHPYTRGLVAAIPQPVVGHVRTQPAIRGELPSAVVPPSGCVFRTRCPIAQPMCAETPPPKVALGPGHWAACHFAGT